jgi:hypothetical protein
MMNKSAAFYAGLGSAFEKHAIPMGATGMGVIKRKLPDIGGFLSRVGRGKKGGAPVATSYRPPGMRVSAKPAAGLPFQQGLRPTPAGSPVRGAAQGYR